MTSAPSKIRILIADDHPVMRDGIRAAIESTHDMVVVGEAVDGAEAIQLFRALEPDVALFDIQMPRVDGLDAVSAIRAQAPDARIIIFTTYPGDARVMRALKLGACGYLLKSLGRDEIVDAVRTVHAGRAYLPPDVARDVAMQISAEQLTSREVEVLRLIAEGYSNKRVGERLHLSEDTVKGHVKSILDKLGATDRTHAVTLATRRGFL